MNPEARNRRIPGTPSAGRCPHDEPFRIEGVPFTAAEVIEGLAPYLTDERRERIADVVADRTYTVAPVIEGLHDLGNVNAVLRSAEALGFQAVHVIEFAGRFRQANRVAQGAQKWLDLRSWPGTASCIAHLRGQGYRILVTHLSPGARPIGDIAFDRPAALCFGNEHEGVSPDLVALADDCVVLPMGGFTRSFNISVAAALCLYHARRDRETRLGRHGDLSPDDRRRLTASFYLRSVPHAAGLLLRGRA